MPKEGDLVRMLDVFSHIKAHDVKLDKLEALTDLARARLWFWRSTALIGASAILILGVVLWHLAQSCECSHDRQEEMMRY